jgi:hypothetical protein
MGLQVVCRPHISLELMPLVSSHIIDLCRFRSRRGTRSPTAAASIDRADLTQQQEIIFCPTVILSNNAARGAHLLVFSMDRSGKQRQYGDGDGDGALFLSWNCGRSQHHPFNSPIYLSELVRVTISIWIKLTCFVCELECDKYIYEHMLLALLSR